ncbi:MAG: amidohydrolase family protein [Vicinamibacteria bacterium]|nr:amidohydrolase family protein [Vicinamibacteria bacterium]
MNTETFYRAAFVLPVTSAPIRDGFVAIRDGVVTALGPIAERPKGAGVAEVDLGQTILMPGFVNAHTHLELSHLEGAVSADRGFVPWIEDQLRVRAERSTPQAGSAIGPAVAGMEASGTVAVADVSNSLTTVEALRGSGLSALVLHEILGFDPLKAEMVVEQTRAARAAANQSLVASAQADPNARAKASRLRIEVAAHAPHSVSRELFHLLMKAGGVRSIHLAESRSEDDFLRTGGGDWRGFLDRRVGPIPFEPPAKSPVHYLDELGVLTPGILAVHCVRVDGADAKLLARRGAVAVLCPRSNEFLGHGVPPLALLLGHGVPLALGTDSLASCASLNVLEDARLLARKFPRVLKTDILHALTRGGALALDFTDLGEIRSGALAKFAVLPLGGDRPSDPIAFVLNDVSPARGLA